MTVFSVIHHKESIKVKSDAYDNALWYQNTRV